MRNILLMSVLFVVLLSASFAGESFATANDSLVHYTNDTPSLTCVDWGNYIVSASTAALIRFDKSTRAATRLFIPPGVRSTNATIRGLGVDRSGALWILSPDRIPLRTTDFINIVPHPVYDRNGGLPHLRQMVMDSGGGVWVAGDDHGTDIQVSHFTNGGWSSPFDTGSGLAPQSLRYALVDRHGTFWMDGMESGAGREGKAIVTSIASDGRVKTWKIEDGLPTGDLNAISLGQGDDIWIGSLSGVSQLHAGVWKVYPRGDFGDAPHTTPLTIAPDVAGNVWVAGYSELSVFNGSHWINYPLDSIAPGSSAAYSILPLQNGMLWFGTAYGVLQYLNGTFRLFNSGTSMPFPADYISDVVPARTGNPWISTNIGVCRFNGESWDVYNMHPSILAPPQADYSNLVQVSRTGDIWFSYYQQGLGRFDGKTWYNYTVADGLPNDSIFGIVNGRGPNDLWILSSRSLVHWDGSQFKSYAMNDTAQHARIFESIACDSMGTVWVGSYTQYLLRQTSQFTYVTETPELWRFDGSAFTKEPMPFADGLSTFEAYGLCVAPNNDLYLAGVQKFDSSTQTYSGGLFKRHTGTWTTIDLTSQFGNKYDSFPFDLTTDQKGFVWIVCDVNNFHGSYQDKVLSEYDGAKWNYVTEANGMDTIRFGHLHSYIDGSVWCGSNYGAYRFVNLKPVEHFSTANGMLFDNVPDAVPSAEGAWFPTEYGLTHLVRTTSSGVTPTTTTKSASSSLSIWPNPCIVQQNGRVHISSSSSITEIEIVDELGRTVLSQRLPVTAEAYDFNPSNLPSGEYHVVIHDSRNQILSSSLRLLR